MCSHKLLLACRTSCQNIDLTFKQEGNTSLREKKKHLAFQERALLFYPESVTFSFKMSTSTSALEDLPEVGNTSKQSVITRTVRLIAFV